MADNQVSQTSSADTPASAAGSYNKNGLGVLALAAIVVSSMLGGGIYSLPQNMAARSLCRSRFAGMADYRFRYLFHRPYVQYFIHGQTGFENRYLLLQPRRFRPLRRLHHRLVVLALSGLW